VDEQIEEKLEKEPKPGRVNYSNIRYAPIINAVVAKDGAVLLTQRSDKMRFYPGYWNGITGYLDGDMSIEDRTIEQLNTELGLQRGDVVSMQRGTVVTVEAPQYNKTWLMMPVLVIVKNENFHLDWSNQKSRWCAPGDIQSVKIWPGFDKALAQLSPIIAQNQ
jgi:isopentenyldiphosphate isomerase